MQPTKTTQVRTAILGLILAVAIIEFGRTTLGKFCVVDGHSMSPTLNAGDVVQSKVSFVLARGDVVVITDDSGKDAIKRIVGLPGEMVTIFRGQVYVNSRQLLEPYLDEPGCTFKNNQKNEPITTWHLAAEEYFVMGDNRCGSCDSRYYGPIRRKSIHGVVDLPKNSPGPALLETMLSESGEVIRDRRTAPTANPNRILIARRSPPLPPRSIAEAAIR